MIFIHAADLHLGSPLGGLDAREDLPADTIRQAPMHAFARIADLCEARGAALLVLAGDLFDGDADIPTMYAAASILERITRSGTKVVTLRGNHDAASRMASRLPGIEGLYELPTDRPGTIELPDIGVAVHGRGFDQQHVPDNIVVDYPAPLPDLLNIGVLHTSLTPAAAGHHKAYAPATIADLEARGYDYWALGHVHQRAVHGEAPWIVFPGNPQGRDVGECGEKGVTVVEYTDGSIVGKPEPVCVDGVRWHVERVELDVQETSDDLLERVRERLRAIVDSAMEHVHVIRLVITGRGAAHDAIAASPEWINEAHNAAMGVSANRLWIERIVLDTAPQLPPVNELTAREDFIGDAARTLLGDVDDVEMFVDDSVFATLDKKLSQLPAGALTDRSTSVEPSELERAKETLLGRLVAQHAEEAGR